ncbi:MAG: alpha/beta fold hydrolase [Polyangiaceae bacterium]|nr:alpha/beta fold hydrolase [Polyangiaceae bacterium]
MTTALLLHGFTGTPRSWDATVSLLPVGVFPHPVTLHGHAGVPVPQATFAAEVERVAALAADSAPVHLVGYSMGGRVALALALSRPELCLGATLIGVSAGLRTAEERAARRAADLEWRRLLLEEGLEAFFAAWDAQPLFATRSALPAPPRARHRAERAGHSARGLASALATLGLAEMPDLHPALERASVPLTFVAGERDAKFRATAAALASLAPGGRCAVVSGAGHDVPTEAPGALGAVLASALARSGALAP